MDHCVVQESSQLVHQPELKVGLLDIQWKIWFLMYPLSILNAYCYSIGSTQYNPGCLLNRENYSSVAPQSFQGSVSL